MTKAKHRCGVGRILKREAHRFLTRLQKLDFCDAEMLTILRLAEAELLQAMMRSMIDEEMKPVTSAVIKSCNLEAG